MTASSILAFACAFGVMFVARNAVGFLSPEIAPALQLQARHLGLLSAMLAGGWAISGWLVPRFLPRSWNTRSVLAALLTVLALDCIATTMATGFAWLMACRLLCGVAGGPVLPLIQGTVGNSGGPGHRGLRMGLVQGLGGSLIAAIIAPIVLVPIAEQFGWHMSFVVIALLAMCVALVLQAQVSATSLTAEVSDDAKHTLATHNQGAETSAAHARRNILLCSLIGSLMVTWLVLTTTFFPVYLTSVKHVRAVDMSLLMALIGAGSLTGVILLPYLSDHFGRRSALGCAALGALGPAALLMDGTSTNVMGALLFVGSLAGGTFPLFLAVVPSDSVPGHMLPASIGIVQVACELIGGVIAPVLVGWLATRHGLNLPVLVVLCSALAASTLAFWIRLDRE